jgi:hypothetical protein
MKKQKGFISIILAIVITAILAGGSTYVLVQDQAEKQITNAVQETSKNIQQQAQVQMEKLAERIEELEKETVIEKEKSNLEEGLVYKNNKYGFSLVFPENWQGYQFEEKDNGIYFGFPEQLDFWALGIMSHQGWDAIKNEEGPKPKYVTENDDYIFVYSTSHDEVPSLQGMLSEVKDIVETFKFLDNIVDWQTYTNEELGISFKYPLEFVEDEFSELFGQLFKSEQGHFWLKAEDNIKNLKTSQEIKDDFYANDGYGYSYEDTFIEVAGINTYKQARYDLGVIERYYILHNNKIIRISFEFNFIPQTEELLVEKKAIIVGIINTLEIQ